MHGNKTGLLRTKIQEMVTNALCCALQINSLFLCTALMLAIFSGVFAQTPIDAGYRDFSYGSTVFEAPTADKPESKLWWNDGSWWGILWDPAANKYRIHRFDLAIQTWANVGPEVDDRSQSLADALWDGQKLYIVSHVYSGGSQTSGGAPASSSGRFYRYTYEAGTKTYSLESGFPVTVNSAISETLVLDKDSIGRLWVTWTQSSKVYLNYSDNDGATWATPFALPTQGANTSSDDISTLIAFNGKIGVVWSNQSDSKVYFSAHKDSDTPTVWGGQEVALFDPSLGAVADDHLNIKMSTDGGGNLYCASKTSLSGTTTPGIYLLKRGFGGGWTQYVVATKADDYTRPIVVIDDENRELYVFAKSGSYITKKKVSLDNISFPSGKGDDFIKNSDNSDINDATASKHNVNSTTGILILASDEVNRYYYHNYLALASNGGAVPTISSFSPTIGPVGAAVTINGNNFTGATNVAFNGTAASFTVNSNTQITATVPSDATTGKISVTKATGAGMSVNVFNVDAGTTQYTLTVNTVGSGSVTLNPAGGVYDSGTMVALTAMPDAGYQFAGWNGDLGGAANPATITMDANKNVTATFVASGGSGLIIHEETVSGGSTGLTTVATATSISGVSGHFYLAAISASKPNSAVSSVSGLGLSWTRVIAQCSGRDNTIIEVWQAMGVPSGSDVVTATLAVKPSYAAMAVSRYSGVDAAFPLGATIAANTVGVNGACGPGSDNSAYSLNFTTTTNGAMIYGATAMRHRSHTPGAGYTERVEILQGSTSSSSSASAAIVDMPAATAGTVPLNGTFSGSADWAVAGLELRPQSSGGTQYTLATSVIGAGSVSPANGIFNDGALVTLTATPAAGYQFDGWSGDLTGATNPATLTLDANKNVTATFTQIPITQYTLTVNTVGSGNVTLNPAGGIYDSGTMVTLTATPDAGYQFTGWSGDLSGTTNPATITMNANKIVTATFALLPPQYTLTANPVGFGSVTLSPAGGVYNSGTVVTLIATPNAGYQFSGWSGDLSGTTNPATITMDANKNVTATFTIIDLSGQVAHQQTVTGSSSSLTTVTTSASLTAMSGQLYLAAISMDAKVAVSSVSGLGLNWTLVKTQCSGKNKTGVEVWMAQGTPSGSGTVTATFVSKPSNAVMAVSRYANVDAVAPIGNMVSGNTGGVNGACAGGVDSKTYSFNLSTTLNGTMVYGAAALRDRSHTPGVDYTERADLKKSKAAVAVEDKAMATAGATTLTGTFSGTVDWAVIGLEIRPQTSSGTQYTLTTNVVGSGSVVPAGGSYSEGANINLTATPASGYQFAGWSGDLSGAVNPAALTMNANKNVTATFTQIPITQYTLTVNTTGSGNVALNPSGGVYNSGTVVTLTATPDAGYQFTGWSGDLTGATNPATITMSANKNVTANFSVIGGSGQVVHEETVTGGSSASTTVSTSASLTGANGHLYLAAIAAKSNVSVSSVAGLGLAWTRVKAQCAGRNQTGVEIWMALGTPSGNDAVTATLASAPNAAVIIVSRYSGVEAASPLGALVSGNTVGVSGACSGGVDNAAYSFNLTTATNGAMIYGAMALRSKTNTPGLGYTERGELIQVGSSSAGLAVQDQSFTSATAVTFNGTLSGVVDWAVIALEIKPQLSLSKRAAKENTLPASFALEPNFPNPFGNGAMSRLAANSGTVINFSLPASGKVSLSIYDETGGLVRRLVDGEMASGHHAARWNGRSESGRLVAAGMYFYKIVVQSGNGNAVFTATKRMTLLK